MEDILDDPRLNSLSLADQMLYVRLLAVLNRQKSRDGWGHLDRHSACSLAKRERWAYAEPAYRRLAAGGLVRLRYRGGTVEYLIPKWPENQGFTPAGLRRDSGQTPVTTPTPTPTSDIPPPTPPRTRARKRSPSAGLARRVEEIWPNLRATANDVYGCNWPPHPSKRATELLIPLLRRGVPEADLVTAIHGCAALNRVREEPERLMYVRAQTVYQPTKFDGYVELGREVGTTGKRKTAVDRYLEEEARRDAEARKERK